MQKILRIVLPVVAVVGAGAYGIYRMNSSSEKSVTVGRIVTVKVGDVTRKVSENGTLEPVRRVDVKSRVAGRLRRILVQEGDTVTVGQTMALVDPIDVERDVAGVRARLAASKASLQQAEENYALTKRQSGLSIARAQASLNESKARLKQTAAPTRTQDLLQAQQNLIRAQQAVVRARQGVVNARQSVTRAEAQVTNLQLTFKRRQSLLAKGFVSQADVDSAETQVTVAKADVETAKSGVQSAQSDVQGAISDEKAARERVSLLKEGTQREVIETARMGVKTAEIGLQTEQANAANADLRLRDIERARAEITQIENQLGQQLVQLAETKIVAPIGGEIISKNIEEGELIASATSGFAQGAIIVGIADLNRMQVRVNINEVDVARVRIGQPVEVRVDGVPNKVFVGRVSSIAPASINENTKAAGQSNTAAGVVRFQVKVAVQNVNHILRPGMTAAVNIITDKHEKVTVVASEAIQSGGKVTVVTGAGKTLAKTDRKVVVGLKSETLAEIQSGLVPGDKVEIPKIDAKDRRKINVGPGGDGDGG